MIVLAALVYLPIPVVAIFATVVVAGSNMLDRVPFNVSVGKAPADILFIVLHSTGPILPFGDGGLSLMMLYPLLPWVGVMAGGYVLGGLYDTTVPADRRKSLLIWLAAIGFALFLVLRATNLYGDPAPWSVQMRGNVYTVLSFINVTKYPVSFLYLLLTLSPALVFLALTDRTNRVAAATAECPQKMVYHLWPRPTFLLYLTMVRGTRGGSLTSADHEASSRFRTSGCICDVDSGSSAAVLPVPMVRGRQDAAARLVAQLYITAFTHTSND